MSPDRDRILEQALKHELHAADVTATPACLDAETLAAWEDGGLDAAAMQAAEVHLSTCGRCQALAATMAKAVPVTVPVKSDEPFRLWKWWLAPIAAATAAVTIWMVVPAQRETVPAMAESVSADAPAPARDAALQQGAPRSAEVPEARASAPAEAPVAAEKQKDQLADRIEQRAGARPEPQKPIDVTLGRVQQRADAAAPAAQAEDRRKREENLEAKKEDADTSKLMRENAVAAAETARAAAAAPAPAAAPPPASAPLPPAAPRAVSEPGVALQKSAGFAAVAVEIVSPDPLRRWRSVATVVERSEDGGRTWIPVRTPGGEITSGMSPARNIVWLAGRAGLVLVAVDGVTFARVDLPERTDVASITASDGRSATVTTTDGRTFRTDDSGRSWRRN